MVINQNKKQVLGVCLTFIVNSKHQKIFFSQIRHFLAANTWFFNPCYHGNVHTCATRGRGRHLSEKII